MVANVNLRKTIGQGSGWIVITAAWGIAVAVAAYSTGWISGAHLNPAVSLAFCIDGSLAWSLLPGYIIAQVLGAGLGAFLAYLAYKKHFDLSIDQGDDVLGIFATGPAIDAPIWNVITDIIGTFVLTFGLLAINHTNNDVGALSAFLAGLLVFGIGMSLGGATGYAINPARDLGPRIIHHLVIKKDSNWAYAWVPIVGPLIGGGLGAICYKALMAVWM